MKKTALLFGASGLTGSFLLQQLLQDPGYQQVIVFGRRKLEIAHPKLSQQLLDIDKPNDHINSIKADALFCCLGTTIRKAGSQQAFRKVDHDFVVSLMQMAEKNKIPRFLVISSMGANAGSRNFYLRTKGEMEAQLEKTGIAYKTIVRPSLIMGNRNEWRLGESVAVVLMKLIGPLMFGPLKKYRSIKAETIARAMHRLSHENHALRIIESDTLQKIGSLSN